VSRASQLITRSPVDGSRIGTASAAAGAPAVGGASSSTARFLAAGASGRQAVPAAVAPASASAVRIVRVII
jgi:hypothetical protein